MFYSDHLSHRKFEIVGSTNFGIKWRTDNTLSVCVAYLYIWNDYDYSVSQFRPSERGSRGHERNIFIIKFIFAESYGLRVGVNGRPSAYVCLRLCGPVRVCANG